MALVYNIEQRKHNVGQREENTTVVNDSDKWLLVLIFYTLVPWSLAHGSPHIDAPLVYKVPCEQKLYFLSLIKTLVMRKEKLIIY